MVSPSSGDRRPPGLRRTPAAWVVLAPACASLAMLAPGLAAPFFWDDHVFLFVARRMPLHLVLERGLLDVYFRPLGGILLWLMSRILGDGPVPYHAVGAGVVAASAALTAGLVRRWTRDSLAALWAGLLAAAVPTAVVAGAWLANIFSALSVGLGLAAMAAAARPTLALGLALAAVLAKEDGILWLPGVLLLIHRERGGSARRTALAAMAALAGLVGIAGWRHSVLGGAGGVVPIPRLLDGLPGGALTLVPAAAGTVALMVLVRRPLVRAAIPLTVGGCILGVVLHRSVPADPHRLWLRFFVLAAAGAVLLAGCALAAVSVPRRWAAAVAGGTVALCAVASLGWEARWLTVTRASRDLVAASIAALDGHPGIEGPVWIRGPGDEIALSAAVGRLRTDLLERAVPLRERGINVVVCPRRLWPSVRRVLALSPLAGNPSMVCGWVVGMGAPRGGTPGVPALRVGTGAGPGPPAHRAGSGRRR